MADTTTPGRIDIVIFTNGGREVIGRTASDPKVKESIYMPLVAEFVSNNVPVDKPAKYTGYYSVTNDECSMSWGDYEGEIVKEETTLDNEE